MDEGVLESGGCWRWSMGEVMGVVYATMYWCYTCLDGLLGFLGDLVASSTDVLSRYGAGLRRRVW